MKLYMVGGAVRDELLGVKSKDIDYTVVLSGNEDGWHVMGGHDSFNVMRYELVRMGFKIFLETPEFFTVRAQFPDKPVVVEGNDFNFAHPKLTADFVLARKESDYTDGRRPDKVVPGTLEDDLARRDFCFNAIAMAPDGSLIDPFNGVEDIERRVIRAVGDPMDRLREDALRAVRALRFSVTKRFNIELELSKALSSIDVAVALERISDERIQQELSKMFRFDTPAALYMLSEYPRLTDAMFAGSVSLDATMKTKGRG